MYFTYHPLEWEVWIGAYLGEDTYAELKEQAMTGKYDLNYDLIIIGLKEMNK